MITEQLFKIPQKMQKSITHFWQWNYYNKSSATAKKQVEPLETYSDRLLSQKPQ